RGGPHRLRGRAGLRLRRAYPYLLRDWYRHHPRGHAAHARRRAGAGVMKIEGTQDIPAPQDKVWAAFLDPGTLAKAIPGCEGLEEIGPGEYKAVMKVGVGAIKGTFEGKVRLSDLDAPNRYRMAVEGKGSPGFVRGDATMS